MGESGRLEGKGSVGKRGPRNPGVADVVALQAVAPQRPHVAWDRLVLEEADAAVFLKMSRSAFRERAAAGEFPRYGERGGYRYYVYDLVDWLLSRRQGA